MRIQQRLARLERELTMGACPLCGPGGEYHVLMAFWPNGIDNPPCLDGNGREIPDSCPGCGESILFSGRPIKLYGGLDPRELWPESLFDQR